MAATETKLPTTTVSDVNPSSSPSGSTSRSATPERNPTFRPVPLPTTTHESLHDYFTGPLDVRHHSKYPLFLRLHGSVLPKMLVPLCFVAGWATAVSCISKFVYKLEVNSLLLTVLGFVVSLGLNFRSNTGYERYSEGARYWAQLQVASRNLARIIWVHVQERHKENPELGKSDLLAKLTALNLISAYAVALKHRLRFEPASSYPDLAPLTSHITTMASLADQAELMGKKRAAIREVGAELGLSFAVPNPRRVMKLAKDNLGNIPLEILTYLQVYQEHLFRNGLITCAPVQTNLFANMAILADVAAGTERIINHPMPLAYSISIAQMTWVYIIMLPFQLFKQLGWITIPATIVAAYIILGLKEIGSEIEDPFGNDVNDLPLDIYCRDLAADIDVLTATPAPTLNDWVENSQNKVLFPLSLSSYDVWKDRSVDEIREALRQKATDKDVHAKRAYTLRASCQVEQEKEKVVGAVFRKRSQNESKTSGHDANGSAV